MAQLSDDCFAFGGPLMTLQQAADLMAARLSPVVETESIGLMAAFGRVLAEDLAAPANVPPHDNSAVDGYAVHFDDLKADAETRLPLVEGRAAAGPVGADDLDLQARGTLQPELDGRRGADDVHASHRGGAKPVLRSPYPRGRAAGGKCVREGPVGRGPGELVVGR